MYSSIPENDYTARRARAEEEARSAYGRAMSGGAVPVSAPEESAPSFASEEEQPRQGTGRLLSLLSRVKEDDLLLIGLLILLFDEHKDDDPLILLILGMLLFT